MILDKEETPVRKVHALATPPVNSPRKARVTFRFFVSVYYVYLHT